MTCFKYADMPAGLTADRIVIIVVPVLVVVLVLVIITTAIVTVPLCLVKFRTRE